MNALPLCPCLLLLALCGCHALLPFGAGRVDDRSAAGDGASPDLRPVDGPAPADGRPREARPDGPREDSARKDASAGEAGSGSIVVKPGGQADGTVNALGWPAMVASNGQVFVLCGLADGGEVKSVTAFIKSTPRPFSRVAWSPPGSSAAEIWWSQGPLSIEMGTTVQADLAGAIPAKLGCGVVAIEGASSVIAADSKKSIGPEIIAPVPASKGDVVVAVVATSADSVTSNLQPVFQSHPVMGETVTGGYIASAGAAITLDFDGPALADIESWSLAWIKLTPK